MATTFFLHRIQKNDGAYVKGIEVHTNLNDAIRSFWGRVKTGWNNPQNPDMDFVSCKITDDNGATISKYDMTWLKEGKEAQANVFFLHTIRKDGDTYTKEIDIFDSEDAAKIAYASAMEYGYNNPKFPDITFVSCEITDLLSGGMSLISDKWAKPESEPEGDGE